MSRGGEGPQYLFSYLFIYLFSSSSSSSSSSSYYYSFYYYFFLVGEGHTCFVSSHGRATPIVARKKGDSFR